MWDFSKGNKDPFPAVNKARVNLFEAHPWLSKPNNIK